MTVANHGPTQTANIVTETHGAKNVTTVGLAALQRQAQTASPRLQQAVKLLQMSSLEFAALVRSAVDSNPFLEPEDSAEEIGGQSIEVCVPQGSNDWDEGDETSPNQSEREERDLWNADALNAGRQRLAEGTDLEALDRTPFHTSLAGHLCSQLGVMPLTPRDLAAACAVATSLDDDGYLRLALSEVFEGVEMHPAPDEDERRIALCRVQALDPPGVGARSVKECLLLQLPAIESAEQRGLAQAIVSEHMHVLAARDMARLSRLLPASKRELVAACDAIRRLNPRPGWRVDSGQVEYVVPDVITRKQGQRWSVSLNPAVVPRVRLNEVYAALFQRHRCAEHAELADNLKEARWTMHYVGQRYATILDVAQAIVRRQQHFFDLGPMAMKPLLLSDIAQELGMHESTVSRVTNNKFIDTPAGVFELKRFFSRPLMSSNGRACSGTAIRGLIGELIQAEPAQAPLSDVAICRQLSEQGLDVARRTVTKYRQMLRIEPVEKRRRFGS